MGMASSGDTTRDTGYESNGILNALPNDHNQAVHEAYVQLRIEILAIGCKIKHISPTRRPAASHALSPHTQRFCASHLSEVSSYNVGRL